MFLPYNNHNISALPPPQIAMISPGLSSCEHSLNTLRYADRVKELGAQDPLEMKPESTTNGGGGRRQEAPEPMRGVESPDDDLAQLRSLNVSGRVVVCRGGCFQEFLLACG